MTKLLAIKGHKIRDDEVKDETMEENVEQFNAEQLLIYIPIPKGYEFSEINKNDDNKIVLVKKQPKYPKTYVECCEILYPNENFQTVAQPIKGHNGKKLLILQKLLVCRDAYWKISGEQTGLGKPWEPDWDNLSTYHEFIEITKGSFIYSSRVLAFPTEEMRDIFYENFKDLIEECKELL